MSSEITIGQRVLAHGLPGIVRAVSFSHAVESNVYTVELDIGTAMRVAARYVVAA